MKIVLLSVGRPGRSPFGAIFEDYAGRIQRFGVGFEARFVAEVEPGGRYTDDHVKEREARSIAEALPKRAHLVALDPAGATLSSEAFAAKLEGWASPLAVFVVGGPLGLHATMREKADAVVSLSAMTLPHDLARVVAVEQIYRGLTILRRVPYHK